MSSTVGYGYELDTESPEGEEQSEKVTYDYKELAYVTSRAKYGDEERAFIFLRKTVQTAGQYDGDGTATELSFVVPENTQVLEKFAAQNPSYVKSEKGWFLVDYVYS